MPEITKTKVSSRNTLATTQVNTIVEGSSTKEKKQVMSSFRTNSQASSSALSPHIKEEAVTTNSTSVFAGNRKLLKYVLSNEVSAIAFFSKKVFEKVLKVLSSFGTRQLEKIIDEKNILLYIKKLETLQSNIKSENNKATTKYQSILNKLTSLLSSEQNTQKNKTQGHKKANKKELRKNQNDFSEGPGNTSPFSDNPPSMEDFIAALILMFELEQESQDSETKSQGLDEAAVGKLQLNDLNFEQESTSVLMDNSINYLQTDDKAIAQANSQLGTQFAGFATGEAIATTATAGTSIAFGQMGFNAGIKEANAAGLLPADTDPNYNAQNATMLQFRAQSNRWGNFTNPMSNSGQSIDGILSALNQKNSQTTGNNLTQANNTFSTDQELAKDIQQNLNQTATTDLSYITHFIQTAVSTLVNIAGSKTQEGQAFFQAIAALASQLR